MQRSKSMTKIDSLDLNEKSNEAMRLSHSLEFDIKELKEQVFKLFYIVIKKNQIKKLF
jgi:hypothetical protein